MATLDGKRIVILGGSSGIGLGVARAASSDGASVVIASSRRTSIDEALKSLPSNAEGHVVDIARADEIETLFGQLGAFDHLVFTAGEKLSVGRQLDVAAAKKLFDVRYWGSYCAAKFGAPNIRPGGSIVFTSGTAGRRPHAGWALGASVCSAVEGLTRALAIDLAPIRVNLVCPGAVVTPLWDTMPEAVREATFRHYATALPVRHVATPEEIADAYLYLMRQTFSTGEILVVDGGGVLV